MITEDLRRETRVDVRVSVTLYRGRQALSLETSDVSFKGLFLRTNDPPPLRSLVKLEVALADRRLAAHAMAVHVVSAASRGEDRAPGVGLQFWGLSGPDRVAWDDFVRGLVHARRMAVPPRAPATTPAHPAASEPLTPSGVRMLVPPPRATSK